MGQRRLRHIETNEAEQAGATNRLPAASRSRHNNHNLKLEIEGALPVACGRPWTLGDEIMKTISQMASNFRMALEVGAVTKDEVISWADHEIEDCDDYIDDLANISMEKDGANILTYLRNLIDDTDEFEALRYTMGRMHDDLRNDFTSVRRYTRFLEIQAINHIDDLPDDMQFLMGIDDEYELAEKGIYGTLVESKESLMKNLAKYTATP